MFELKKYKVVTPFNGYRAGITVAFNGADAEKYKDFIICTEKPAFIAPVVEKVEAVKKVVKRVRKGRK